MSKKKFSFGTFFFLLLISVFAFIVLPNTSPFASHGTWCMTNDYFNFAKSMMQGKVLYTDLYDHKGLFLFLMYYIPVLISDTSLLGVFIMEGLTSVGIVLSCYRFCSYRYSRGEAIFMSFLVTVLLRLVFPQIMYNTEPLCIIIMFLLLRYIDDKSFMKYRKIDYILFGLAFGVVFWMKFPLVITIFPFWLYIANYSSKYGHSKRFTQRCALSFISFVLFSLPIVGYFLYHGNIKEMFESYFMGAHATFNFFNVYILDISVVAILIIGILGTFLNKEYRKSNVFFLIWFLIIFAITNFTGGVRSYTSCFILVIMCMVLPNLIRKTSGRFISILCLFVVFVLNVPLLMPDYNNYRSVQEIASEYNITNENILYLCEDMGFGTYSKKPFKYKYQWRPSRVPYDENNELYEQTVKWLTEKEFDYICIAKEDFEKEINFDEFGSTHRYANIAYAAQQNYEFVEAFDFNEGVVEPFYICRVKK